MTTTTDPDAGRDRLRNPSINFPHSENEARLALIRAVRQDLFKDEGIGGRNPTLNRTFRTDAGLGHVRTQEATDWLNQQQSVLRAQIEDLLDRLEETTIAHAEARRGRAS